LGGQSTCCAEAAEFINTIADTMAVNTRALFGVGGIISIDSSAIVLARSLKRF
jgi:hypothetical protein